MGIVAAILDVFSEIGNWFVETLQAMIPLFWTAPVDGSGGGLTFLGTLCLVSLGIGLICVFLRIVQNFMRFRA